MVALSFCASTLISFHSVTLEGTAPVLCFQVGERILGEPEDTTRNGMATGAQQREQLT